MAGYGCYEELAREREYHDFASGKSALCRCTRCNKKIYIGEEIADFDGEKYCDICWDDMYYTSKRTLGEEDIPQYED